MSHELAELCACGGESGKWSLELLAQISGHRRERTVGDFRRLKVWQASHQLVLDIYRATASFPASERFGLTAQLRRAGGSIPANIAEGCGRRTDAELRRFIRISLGSATEIEYHLLLSSDLGWLDRATHDDLYARTLEIQKMLAGLDRRLHRSAPSR